MFRRPPASVPEAEVVDFSPTNNDERSSVPPPSDRLSFIVKAEFRGIGNLFRQYSQYVLMRKWEYAYHFESAVEAPYDHATEGIDGAILRCPHQAARTLDGLSGRNFDLVWNFGFLQREPQLILEMRRVSRQYVAAFVPNAVNPGYFVHKVYHLVYGEECLHPERGDGRYMSVHGLASLFESAGIEVLEAGVIDLPPWPDTVVTIKEFFGARGRQMIRVPVDVRFLFPFERIAHPRRIIAHHCYVLGKVRKQA